MSKIVVLSAKLGAPQILDDLLKKIALKDPALAEWVKQFDAIPVIKECVNKALARMKEVNGIKLISKVSGYGDEKFSGKLDGVISSDRLQKGLGLRVNEKGEVEFIADEYGHDTREEIKRLRKIFTDAFLAEATSAILQILGYEVNIQSTATSNGEVSYYLDGVKQ